MNRALFTSFLKNPSSLTAENSKQLAEVLKEFPYCQTAQLLFVKGLHLQKSIHYNNQLKLAAAYTTDRTLLYTLITTDKETLSPKPGISGSKPNENQEQLIRNLELPVPAIEKQPTINEVVSTPTDKESLKEEALVAEPAAQKAPSPQIQSAQEILEARLKEINEQSAKDKTPATNIPLLTTTAPPEIKQETKAETPVLLVPIPRTEPADEVVRLPALNPSKEVPVLGPDSIAAGEADKTEVQAEKNRESNNNQIPHRKASPVPEPENLVEPVNTDDTLKTVKDIEILTDAYLSSAIDASLQLEVENQDQPVAQILEAEEPTPDTPGAELSFTQWLKRASKTKSDTEPAKQEPLKEEKKVKQSALIEKFITEEPRITKPQKEFYSPVNMARQSVVEDPDFVTETLAGIYAKQGNKAKAIMAYQTLCLKYPEKKLYFASLIEKLETEG